MSSYQFKFFVMMGLSLAVAIVSSFYGAVEISFNDITSALTKFFSGADHYTLKENVFIQLRLPRVLLSFAVGGSLALGGNIMQALFRNPIIEPGLIGTSSGAAFGASVFIVFGSSWGLNWMTYSLPFFAFLGTLLATFLVFFLSSSRNGTSVVTMLLTGVAVNALFLSGIGIFSYIARDPQARSITFWSLGTLSGADWTNAIIVSLVLILSLLFAFRLSKDLNAMALGEADAHYLGVDVKRLKLKALLLNVIIVSVATSFVGVVSFVGLIIPNMLRLLLGSDNRSLSMFSILAGGTFLCFADLLARVSFSPAELPIGIVTSFVGVPVFIYLLRTHQNLPK